jgi:hypothetical protein
MDQPFSGIVKYMGRTLITLTSQTHLKISIFASTVRGDFSILLTKSGLDGIASVAFASTLGIGVLFSTLPVAAYQGGITIAASMLEPYLSSSIVNEMTATGGLLILGIALNILQVTKIKVGNLLPAILVAAIVPSLAL